MLHRKWLLGILCLVVFMLAPANAYAERGRPARSVEARPEPTNRWAVQIADGANPDRVAAQLGATNLGQIGQLDYYSFEFADSDLRPSTAARPLAQHEAVTHFVQVNTLPLEIMQPTDPEYPDQWHLNNYGQNRAVAGNDINVVPAWNQGYTGFDVDIGIVEGNFQIDHPDIAPNYDRDTSIPKVPTVFDSHATSVAGISAADNDGSSCGVGVAYNASLATLNWAGEDGGGDESGGDIEELPSEDAIAEAWTKFYNETDIYNNSWGPSEPLHPLPLIMQAALQDGVRNGRNGLGAIYVAAAGNGRTEKWRDDDNPFNEGDINENTVANIRYTIAVAASTADGDYAGYSTPGAAILVNAPSSGYSANNQYTAIQTTDLEGFAGYTPVDCTGSQVTGFNGTSAAAPMVSGVVALMLEANPNLTWRDVQHILVETSDQTDVNNPSWKTNAAGYTVSRDYGHGRVNAAAAVDMARTWNNVSGEYAYVQPIKIVNADIPDGLDYGVGGEPLTDTITVPNNVRIEHVEVVVNARHQWRGELEFELTSPSGTTSELLTFRPDDTLEDYVGWRLASTHYWGEFSAGEWTLSVQDRWDEFRTGRLNSWRLFIYGTIIDPDNLTADYIPREDHIEVNWNNFNSIPDTYIIERSPNGTDSWQAIGTVNGNITTFVDPNVACGETWYYRVRGGTGNGGFTAYTNVDSATSTRKCLPEDIFAFYEPDQHEVGVLWDDSPDNAVTFLVQRQKNGAADTWVDLGFTPDNIGFWTDTTVTCDQLYLYRIIPYKGGSAIGSPQYSNLVDTECDIFTDVPSLNQPPNFEMWIEDLYYAGVTTGCNDGTPGVDLEYCPEQDVSRGQMALFILRALNGPGFTPSGIEPDPFADVPSPNQPPTFENWIENFYTLGITGGCAENPLRYCPETSVNRGSMAVFILRALNGGNYSPTGMEPDPFVDVPTNNQPPYFEPFIEEFYSAGITTGCSSNPLRYCPETDVSRGQMAVFILRAFDNLPDPDDP